jgi:hypothetical protein
MICNTDKDCDLNQICSFNPDDLKHYCINNEIENLYEGCIKNDSNMDNIEIVNSNNVLSSDYKKCIDFGRRQLNKDGFEYNYMIFKPEKNVYVDTTTINIYLKCDGLLIASIPYEDYFKIKCDNDQKNCILTSNKSLINFIIKNTENCIGKNIYLEIVYECENEKVKNTQNISIDLKSNDPIKIELKCPIEINNFKPSCQAVYIDNNGINNNEINIIDNNVKFYDCQKPIYKLPIIVDDINNYKKKKKKQTSIELKNHDNKINQKINELKKLEAEKYMKLKIIQTGKSISFEEAYKIIDKISISKLISTNNWNIFKNYDAAQNLFDQNVKNQFITYFGKVYTLQEALNVANQNNQNFFVWYHNSFEFNDYASKLFFIDIFYVDDDLLQKSNWSRSKNVTTCLIKFDFEHFNNEEEDENSDDMINYKNQLKEIANKNNKPELIYNESHDLFNTYISNSQNIYDTIIKSLDRKNTTLGQAVSMNNYETNINNKITLILGAIAGILLFIFLTVFIYYNYIKERRSQNAIQ